MNRELIQRARNVKIFFCDSDGVLFRNATVVGAPHAKERSYYDGQGISLLRAVGIRVVFITNEKGDGAQGLRETIAKWNALPSSQSENNSGGWEPVTLFEGRGGEKKLEAAEEYVQKNGLTLADAAYMGDDLVDVPLLSAVLLPACPAQAEDAIKKMCLFVAAREGGAGAIRDFANMVLGARDIDPSTLPHQ